MAATINASTSPAGIVQTADGTGILSLQTGNTTALTIDASQNVGIGTATPVRMLDVSKTTGDAGVAITSSTTGQSSIFFADTDTNVGMIYYEHTNDAMGFRTNDAERMRIDSSGNVGIGTASPDRKLNVTGAAATETVIKISGSTTAGTFLHTNNTGGNFYMGKDNSAGTAFGSAYCSALYSDSAYPMIFWTNGTERMRIDSSGNTILGSNTSTTAYNKLNLYTPASTLSGIFMEKLGQVVVQMGFKATTNTDFFIGTGSYTLGTYGVYLANTGTSWISNSDERQKDIIEPIENALTKVNTLRAVIGKYKHDEEGVRRSFLIAQDVQAVFPEAVKIQDDEEAKLGLSYTDVIPLLVASIKELKAELDTAKARITALEGA